MKNLYLVEGVGFYLVKGVGFYLVKGFIHYPGEIVSRVYRRRWLMDEGWGQRSNNVRSVCSCSLPMMKSQMKLRA